MGLHSEETSLHQRLGCIRIPGFMLMVRHTSPPEATVYYVQNKDTLMGFIEGSPRLSLESPCNLSGAVFSPFSLIKNLSNNPSPVKLPYC